MLTKTHTNIGKGIAILLVIFGHILLELFHVHTFIQSIGVFLFLILSGYGITASVNSNPENKKWFARLKRMKKIMVPYWLVTICKIIALMLLGVLSVSVAVIAEALFFDMNKTIDATMWFILYIIVWYITGSIIFSITKNKMQAIISFFLVASIFMVSVDLPNWAFYAFGLPIGVLWNSYEHTSLEIIQKIPGWLYLALFISLAIASTSVVHSFKTAMPTTLLAALLVLCFVYKVVAHNSILEYLGKNSYELYLIEGFWLYSTGFIYDRYSEFINLFLYLGLLIGSYLLWVVARKFLLQSKTIQDLWTT
ncbi:acyltransferase family protein [Listeria booriae]|uniref:Acyltransferase family protein n=1 Tax=Listeria booriae TaxID=1552123 RepID=A0A842CYP2_9LIST|nr:acyltransferase family protein [Listeria booriae]MBC2003772.1 acyltransferase family protein [Listeria booriae]